MAARNLKAHNCTAKSKTTGTRCARPAIEGGTVCIYHGGSAPQVKHAARRRLLEMIDPALGRLAEALDSPDEKIRMQAIREVLNRTGIDTPQEITLTLDVVQQRIAELEADDDHVPV